jgi:hypothetical protein
MSTAFANGGGRQAGRLSALLLLRWCGLVAAGELEPPLTEHTKPPPPGQCKTVRPSTTGPLLWLLLATADE